MYLQSKALLDQNMYAYLTNECTEITGAEAVIHPRENRDGDDNVAEETSQVVKGVHPN